jgi:hypothetical protein
MRAFCPTIDLNCIMANKQKITIKAKAKFGILTKVILLKKKPHVASKRF